VRAAGGASYWPLHRDLQAQYNARGTAMKIKAIVHEAEEGGFWAEVPAIPGCATEGETMEELLENLQEAIEGCLSVEVSPPEADPKQKVVEIAL